MELGLVNDYSSEAVKEAWRNFVSQNYNVPYSSQHQVMIVGYMDIIASSLRELNSNKFTNEHYKFLVWEALENDWDDYIDEQTKANWSDLYNEVKNDPNVYSWR